MPGPLARKDAQRTGAQGALPSGKPPEGVPPCGFSLPLAAGWRRSQVGNDLLRGPRMSFHLKAYVPFLGPEGPSPG